VTEREALLKAVCDNPDDDTPRLVFADWLQEHGDEARAEFIRLQVYFAALYRGGISCTATIPFGQKAESAAQNPDELRALERAIWAEHQQAFRAELPHIYGVAWFSEFHRGFVERMTVSTDVQLVRYADTVFANVPIRHVEIAKFGATDGFAELPHLGRLKTLRLFNRRPTEPLVRRLAACEQLSDDALLLAHFGDDFSPTLRSVLERAFGARIRFYA
jgi:uncharacterized protein (TIGR02996 family)